MLPLAGVKVIDLSKVLAGPWCGQSLGELGADVLKIEPVGGGDDTRAWGPQKHGQSATFLAVNHYKRSLAVDLKSKAGQDIVHRLIQSADVVIQGFGSGTASRLKVDYETLSALNPKLIYCEISGYGRSGPLGDQPGYDVMLQAFSGMIHSMGSSHGDYARASFSPVDIGTGMNAVSGILAALLLRERTGKGQYLEISLLRTATAFMGYMAQNYWHSGHLPKKMGTGHPSLCPYQVFEAADHSLMIGVGTDPQWRRLCEVIGIVEEVDAPSFSTNAMRIKNFDKTVALVASKIKKKNADLWLTKLRSVGVPCSPIHHVGEAVSHPQVLESGILSTGEHAVLGSIQHIGFPVKFSTEHRGKIRSAPVLGEHTAEVLLEAGFSDYEIEDMIRHGIVESWVK